MKRKKKNGEKEIQKTTTSVKKEKKVKEKDNYGECNICCTEDMYMGNVLLPCKHTNICEDCAIKFVNKPCPFCRERVTKWKKNKKKLPKSQSGRSKSVEINMEQIEAERNEMM